MSKKTFKISGTVFAILTFIILFFPWVYAYHSGEVECCDFTTTGFGLTEFSAWGTIIFILPILILGITCSKLGEKTKTMFLFGLYLLGSISFYYATSIGIEWLKEVSTEYVRPKSCMFLYPIFMFFSLLSFYFSYNTKNCSLLNMIGIEVCNEADEDIGELCR